MKRLSCDKHLFGAFVHSVNRGSSQGGLRFLNYNDSGSFFDDGLRLSYGMSQKSSLAGLWCGGGKGILTKPDDFEFSNKEK